MIGYVIYNHIAGESGVWLVFFGGVAVDLAASMVHFHLYISNFILIDESEVSLKSLSSTDSSDSQGP